MRLTGLTALVCALILSAASALAELPSNVTTSTLRVVGTGNKFGPSATQSIVLPSALTTQKLSIVGRGAIFGPSASQTINLPASVTIQGLKVIGRGSGR